MPRFFMPPPCPPSADGPAAPRRAPGLSVAATVGALSASLLLHGSVPVVFDRPIARPEERPVEIAVHWVEPEAPTEDRGATEVPPEEEPARRPARPPAPAEPPPPVEPELADETEAGDDDDAPTLDEAPPVEDAAPEPPPPETKPRSAEIKPTTEAEPPPAETEPPPVEAAPAEAPVEPPKARVTKTKWPPRHLKPRDRIDPRRGRARRELSAAQRERQQALAELRRRAALKKARLAKLRQARGRTDGKGQDRPRAKKKRTPPPELRQGRVDEVWACEAEDRGRRALVQAEEPITDWVGLVPTVMFTFPTEPGLTGWMEGVSRIKKRDRRYDGKLGPVELALPSTPIEVAFEDPRGTVGRLGRADARCLVGFKWNGKKLWPFTVTRLPAELVDEEGHTLRALVDVTFYEDATFELAPHREDDGPLLVTGGRLEGGDFIENTIASHLKAAKMAKSVSDMFGIDLRRFTETGRKQIAYEKKVREKQLEAKERQLQRAKEREQRERAAKKRAAREKKLKARGKPKPDTKPPSTKRADAQAAERTNAPPKKAGRPAGSAGLRMRVVAAQPGSDAR